MRTFVYYETIKRELHRRLIYEGRCDERLKSNTGDQSDVGEFFVYYESIKREPKIRGIYECRCDERLQNKTKKFTRLPYTGLVLELEHLKIETRLISEMFANAMGECANSVALMFLFFPFLFFPRHFFYNPV
jgi:hypothetical protein